MRFGGVGRLVATATFGALALSACAEEEPQEFTEDNRAGFLAACTQPLEDSRTISAVCQCVFDETQDLGFDRFRAIDEALLTETETEAGEGTDGATGGGAGAGLPDDLAEIIAGCLIGEAGL